MKTSRWILSLLTFTVVGLTSQAHASVGRCESLIENALVLSESDATSRTTIGSRISGSWQDARVRIRTIDSILNPLSEVLPNSPSTAMLVLRPFEIIRKRILLGNEWAHLARLDAYQLQNENYREWFVDKLVDLRIKRTAAPLAAFEYSSGKTNQKALRRVLVTSVLSNGLRSWMNEQAPTPGSIAKIKRVVRTIRFSPFFRFAVEWQLPHQMVRLTDGQIESVLTYGEGAFDREPSLRNIKFMAVSTSQIKERVAFVRTLLLIGMTLHSSFTVHARIVAQEELRQQAAAEAEAARIQAEIQQTRIDKVQVLLGAAKDSYDILMADFEMKNGPASPAIQVEAHEYICRTEFGNAFKQDEIVIAACMKM